MAAKLLRKIDGGSVFELDDPYSDASIRHTASEGEKHFQLTPGQKRFLAVVQAPLEITQDEQQEPT